MRYSKEKYKGLKEKILSYMRTGEVYTANDIAKEFKMQHPTASHLLTEIYRENSHIISTKQIGNYTIYTKKNGPDRDPHYLYQFRKMYYQSPLWAFSEVIASASEGAIKVYRRQKDSNQPDKEAEATRGERTNLYLKARKDILIMAGDMSWMKREIDVLKNCLHQHRKLEIKILSTLDLMRFESVCSAMKLFNAKIIDPENRERVQIRIWSGGLSGIIVDGEIAVLVIRIRDPTYLQNNQQSQSPYFIYFVSECKNKAIALRLKEIFYTFWDNPENRSMEDSIRFIKDIIYRLEKNIDKSNPEYLKRYNLVKALFD